MNEKKAKRGIRTHQKDVELIKQRLRAAQSDYKRRQTRGPKEDSANVEEHSGKVFADLGFPHPEREALRMNLTLQIYRLIKSRGLTQKQAGEILGIKQPHVSTLMRGRSGHFSVERLFEFLNALGQDVEIAVRPKLPDREEAQTSVVVQM